MSNETENEKVKRPSRRTAKPKSQAAVLEPEPAAVPVAPAIPQPEPQKASVTASPQLDILAEVRDATSNTVRIVQKAVSVLEQELASGIQTTKKFEQKLVDVDKLRGSDPQEVVQRFRRDAHDVVDILIDLVNVATNSLDQITQRVIKIGVNETRSNSAEADGKGERTGGGIPSLAVSQPVKPGGAVEIPMTLQNESSKPTEVFYLLSSDLINPNGDRIAAHEISFAPEKMVIDPQKSAVITVTVHVPVSTPPGTYSGLLQATKLEQLRAVLSIQIE